jgi:hypothetical protein
MSNITTTGISSTCPHCGGYINLPPYWHGTVAPRMCTCASKNGTITGWLCPRCHKSNAPYKATCDCLPANQYQIT